MLFTPWSRNPLRLLHSNKTFGRGVVKVAEVISIHFDCDHNEKHSRRCLAVCCIRFRYTKYLCGVNMM
jgi:hypothetical protein